MINKKQILLSFVLVLFLFNLDIIIKSVFSSSKLFFNQIFISIFPFIVLSDILIYFDYHIFLSNTIGKFISKIFNIDRKSTIVFILSILTSQPSNSIYLKSLLDKKIIDVNEANKVMAFTYFPSVAFVIGSIGISMYNNVKAGLLLLASNYLCNICIGIYLRRKSYESIDYEPDKVKANFFSVLKEAILKSFNTCFIILGNIIIFTIIINILNSYININPVVNSLMSGIFEMTSGIKSISMLDITLKYKIILTSFVLNFSGLSIIFQSRSILSDYNINIKKILTIKLVFSFIFSLLTAVGAS